MSPTKSRRSKGKIKRRKDDGETDTFTVFAGAVVVLSVVAIVMSGAMHPSMWFTTAQRASPVPR